MKDELLLQNYFLAKKITSTYYNQDFPYYNFLLLSCFALLTKYKDSADIIQEILEKAEIIIKNIPLNDILKDIVFEDQLSSENDIDDVFFVATSFNGIGFSFDTEKKEISLSLDNPLIAVSTYLYSQEEILESLTHELAHIIKSYYNNYKIDNKNGYCIARSGIHIIVEYLDGRFISSNELLDEALNVLQVQDMLKNVQKLAKILPTDDSLKDFLKTFDFQKLESIMSYENITNLLKDVWSLDNFKDLFEKYLLTGEIDVLKEQFNNYVGANCFEAFSTAIDSLFSNPNDDNARELIENIKKVFKIKNSSSKEIYLKIKKPKTSIQKN